MSMEKHKWYTRRWKHTATIAVVIALLIVVGVTIDVAARGVIRKWGGGVLARFGAFPASAPSAPTPPALYKPVLEYERSVIEAVKKASPAVVSISISKNVPIIKQCPAANPLGNLPADLQQLFGSVDFSVPCQKGTSFEEVGGGSGFIIDAGGLIITNKHVVSDTKASYTVITNDGKKYPAKILARDPVQDIAVLKIEAEGLPVVTVGDSDAIELGQTAIAIGNTLAEFKNTVSVGVISGLSRTVTAGDDDTTETIRGVLQTDAAVNLGNSGGPLLNLAGEVIGINTATASDAQSVGFAIPINQVKKDIASVKATGKIEVAFLGVRYRLITPEIAKKEKLPVEYGAIVEGGKDGLAVEKNSPAQKAGIRVKDIIVAINGKKITENITPGEIITQYGVGELITITIIREGKEITTQVALAARPVAK